MSVCPCCQASHTRSRAPRTQSNGLVIVSWKCLTPGCQFSWSTINGRISDASRHSLRSYRDHLLRTRFGDVLDPDEQARRDRFDRLQYQQP